MFTGIVETVGLVASARRQGFLLELTVNAPSVAPELNLGDSVAIDGVGTTVTEKTAENFTVQLQEETLKRTFAASYRYGDKVNLERAVTPQTRLGGHFVQGHVDCCVPVRSFHREGGDMVLRFRIPPELSPYCVEKGFVAVNGISLTIVSVRPEISVHVIPATLNNTTLKDIRVGSLLNIETDILGKYVQAALKK